MHATLKCTLARMQHSHACMHTSHDARHTFNLYVHVFVSACVRVSVARLHVCVCVRYVYVLVLHACMRACLACVQVYVRGEATRQSTEFFISGH